MTGHTYKSTGYDPNLKGLVFAPHELHLFLRSAGGQVVAQQASTTRSGRTCYVVTLCATPQGAVVWADQRDGKQPGCGGSMPRRATLEGRCR